MIKKKYVNLFIFLFLIFSIVFPLTKMLMQVKWDGFLALISSITFKTALINSLSITIISTILSLLIACFLAYTINKTNIKHKAVLKMLITIPMLIPSVSHGLGLINLFGANGIISKQFGFDIIGFSGIVIGSIMYSFPIAFLIIDDGFKYIDNNLYDSAKVLGLNKYQIFKKVTYPYIKKPIFSSMFAVFSMIFTDYGVPLAVGGKFTTLPVFLYKEVIGLLDYSTGTMIGIFLLLPAIISFLFDTISKDYTISNIENSNNEVSNSRVINIILKIFTYMIITFILVVILSFLYYAFIDNIVINPHLSLKHIQYTLDYGITKFIFNSLLISIGVAILGTIISYSAAYLTARNKGKIYNLIHILILLSLTIPGIVLGLSYTISYNGSIIYNTFIILILVNVIHFIASPYLMAYNAMKKINPNYEIIAKTCNINIFNLIKDVIIPCTKSTIREMFVYFFVNSMITISAIVFLFNANTMSLSLLINNFEGNMMFGEAAIISLIILFFNILLKIIIYLINRKEERKKTL